MAVISQVKKWRLEAAEMQKLPKSEEEASSEK